MNNIHEITKLWEGRGGEGRGGEVDYYPLRAPTIGGGGEDEVPIGTYKIDIFTCLVARIQNRCLWITQLNIILMI